MILSFALSVTMSLASAYTGRLYGEWRGQCYRGGSLQGMDHELCSAELFDENIAAGAELVRTAEGIKITSFPGECKVDFEPVFLPASAVAGADRATIVTVAVQRQIDNEMKACKPNPVSLTIRKADIAAFLKDSDNLRPGSFVLLDPAKRAPAARKCGRKLEISWQMTMKRHPVPDGAEVGLLMYTFSKEGPDRAYKRFSALPAMMASVGAFATGPGGAAIFGRTSAESWRNPPSKRFVTMCDVAIESWSSFVELLLYDQKDGHSPAFTVRASTGVAGAKGYTIWSGGSQ